jgi:glycerate kinase
MKIVIAPVSLKGSASAQAAAAAIARGAVSASQALRTTCAVVQLPIADGGEGTAAALAGMAGATVVRVPARDAVGRALALAVTHCPDGACVFDAAAVCGFAALPHAPRNPWRLTSASVGKVMHELLLRGHTRLDIGLGGTLTVDGGAGLLCGLGGRFVDHHGAEIPPDPEHLSLALRRSRLRLEADALQRVTARLDVRALCDVDAPLLGPRGAIALYGPQKGVSPADTPAFEELLEQLADVYAQAGLTPARDARAGAAGGLGMAVGAIGGQLCAGADHVLDQLDFTACARDAQLVITAEGCVDAQTLQGKAVLRVLERCRKLGVPCAIFAGDVRLSAADRRVLGDAMIVHISSLDPDPDAAIARTLHNLETHATAFVDAFLRDRRT